MGSERSEKSKSSQSYTQYSGAARRSSLRPEESSVGGTAAQRPHLGNRANSLPLGESVRGTEAASGVQERGQTYAGIPRVASGHQPQAGPGAGSFAQDEDEVAGVTGAVRQYEPFRSPDVGVAAGKVIVKVC